MERADPLSPLPRGARTASRSPHEFGGVPFDFLMRLSSDAVVRPFPYGMFS